MQLLFEHSALDYVRNSAVGNALLVLVHIPKTAGTSLRAELAQLLAPDVNIEVDYADASRDYHERLDEAVAEFLDFVRGHPVRFASGHIMARHVLRIRSENPDARFVTFVRDPVARLISDYRYQRSPRHPQHLEFRASVPDLDTYLQLRGERNKMAQHLVSPSVLLAADPEECVEYVMRTYSFVGVQEMYDLSFRTLTALIGNPAWPRLRENVNADVSTEQKIEPELKERIRRANPLDCAIYDYFAPRLQAASAGLKQVLG
jgi:hypothetical protein